MEPDPQHDDSPAAAPARPLWSPLRFVRRYALPAFTLSFLAIFTGLVVAILLATLLSEFFHFRTLADLFRDPMIVKAMLLSAKTSLTTLALVVVFCIPMGYALSRYRFPGHAVIDTLVDLPIVMPPLAIGVALLVLFASPPGRWVAENLRNNDYIKLDLNAAAGIVLCQFLLSAPFAVRAAKAAFDGVDRHLEDLALTLGCTRLGAFWRVALPMARGGVIAGGVMAWARAVGLYGPLMVFVGCVRGKSEVLPNTIYLEVSTGGIEVALAATIVMIAMAGAALVLIHSVSGSKRWWGV